MNDCDLLLANMSNPTQTISAKAAAALDKELMSTGAFSIDQLMELAGLSVSQAGMWCGSRVLFTCHLSPLSFASRVFDDMFLAV